MTLTPAQNAVVMSDAPKILCSSCPGSGKSRVLVERIKRLVRDGTDPARIVCLSYTVAASAVLQERLGDIRLGANTTLHAWIFSLLNKHGCIIGLPAGLAVVDADEEKALLQDALDEVAWRGSFKEVEAAVALGPQPRVSGMSKAGLAAEGFFQLLRASGVLTFDLILYYGERLLVAMRSKGLALPVDHLFVDEANDLTEQDWRILDATHVPNFFAVGDGDQRIMSFRGSCGEFETRCKMATPALYQLSENFRCCSAVCTIANKLMQHQPGRLAGKQTVSATGQAGEGIVAAGFETDDLEAHAVAQDIERFGDPNNSAVLLRTNHLVDFYRANLKSHGLPVREPKQVELPDWPRAKAALALLANPDNDQLAYRAIRLASGRDKADEVRRRALSEYKTINALALGLQANEIPNALAALQVMSTMGLSKASLERLGRFTGLLPADAPVAALVLAVGREEIKEDESDGIIVSTIHSMKGREAEAVWIPALEDELFPCSDEDESESRRLLFVGCTRARNYLRLSWAKKRTLKWKGETDRKPSRFLGELF